MISRMLQSRRAYKRRVEPALPSYDSALFLPHHTILRNMRGSRHTMGVTEKPSCLVQASSSVAFTFVVMNDHAGNSNHCEPTAI